MATRFGKIDLHMHTTVSDGTDPPEAILDRVKEAGIGLFSVTDHDAVRGCTVVAGMRDAGDPLFLPGVEFSCEDELGKYHILGYCFDPDAAPIRRVTEHGHELRMTKVRARLDFLAERFGFTFSEEDVARLLAMDNPGKPHIGNLMMQYGYASSMHDAMENYLNLLRFRAGHVSPREAIEGILASGGVPVLAHPCFGSGDELILGAELEDRVRRLMDFGLRGLEAYYSGFSPKMSGEVLGLADRFGLFVTAGSDYHGSNKLVRLGDTGLEGDAVPALRRFFEAVGLDL